MDKFLGKKLDGRYEIMEIIGIGGMSTVYKAYDVIEDRIVAVKILREEFMENEDMRRRFKNESKAMAVLTHPNIMRVYDVSFSDKMQSIVMEYIDGITLKEYIKQQGALKWKEAVHFTVQLLRALQHAHDKGIVHRDIKPQNIMLLSDGTIKITDFGIARFARSETRTLTDKAIGSVHYISPEQASGDTTDARTDIYSAGVILYEMLTGRVPFEADTPVSVALKQIQSIAVLPREINPSIPEGLQEITMHAMEKDVGKRYQSAAQMMRDIDEFKRDPSILFEYKYLNVPLASDENKYSHAIQNVRKSSNGKRKDKVKSSEPATKRAPVIPVLAGVTAAFVIVTALFIGWMVYMNNPFVRVDDVVIPALVGEKYDTVRMSPKFETITIQVIDTDFNDEYGKGVIYEQTPKAGVTVKVGSVVKVKVSTGMRTTTLPNLAGQDAVQVAARLQEWGLESEEKLVYNDTVPSGYVVQTTPGESAQLSAGEVVTLYVSMGKEEKFVTVPDLRTLSLADVRKLLENYKLKLGTITYDEDYDDEQYEPGMVIKQSPAADSQVVDDTTINITVAGENVNVKKKTTLAIALPESVDRNVTMTVMINGIEAAKETVNPATLGTWKPVLEGEGSVEVRVYLDQKIMRVYELDFTYSPPGYRILQDFSQDFEQ